MHSPRLLNEEAVSGSSLFVNPPSQSTVRYNDGNACREKNNGTLTSYVTDWTLPARLSALRCVSLQKPLSQRSGHLERLVRGEAGRGRGGGVCGSVQLLSIPLLPSRSPTLLKFAQPDTTGEKRATVALFRELQWCDH